MAGSFVTGNGILLLARTAPSFVRLVGGWGGKTFREAYRLGEARGGSETNLVFGIGRDGMSGRWASKVSREDLVREVHD